jgi:GAF domain-containing protein
MIQPDDPANPYLQHALHILRDTGVEISRLGPQTSLAEALHLIASTALQLIDTQPGDNANIVIYTCDPITGAFETRSRVSAGEGDRPLVDDTPRPGGVGATALARRSRVLSYEEPHIAFHPLKYEAGIRTAACYPLLVSGQPIGALYFGLYSDRHFTPHELLIFDTFVQLAAVAIYNTRQYQGINRALQRKIDELERLQSASRLISSRLHLNDTLREILAVALELIRADYGSFGLLDKSTNLLHKHVAIGSRHDIPGAGLPIGENSGVMGWAALHRQAIRIDDLHEPPWSEIYRPFHADREMRSELAVPLLGPGGGLEGVLNVESPRVAAFTVDDRQMLDALATQAVIAIQEAKLLNTIEEVTSHLVGHSPDEVFALLIDRVRDLLNVEHAAIWEIDPRDTKMLALRAATRSIPQPYPVPVHGSLLGSVMQLREPAKSLDLIADPRVQRPELVQRLGLMSALIAPLIDREGKARGAFGVYSSEPRDFSDWDMRLLACLANHAAVAIQQAQAVEQLKAARTRQVLAETFAAFGDISANLLHRVNNLIGVIPVRVQGVTDKRPTLNDDAYVASALREIEDSARAAMEAARETIAYLRPVREQATSIERCFDTALKRVKLPPHITVAACGLAQLPPVLASEEQLRLVFFNLIDNASDALGEQPGHIEVRGGVADDPLDEARCLVEIAVQDDGPGIDPALLDRVFDPAFSTKGSAKKMGFGLWWTRSLIQRFGGTIRVDNNPDRGCTFTVHLPPLE